ncbi:50S ribosomal protein L23 [Pseudothermotoga thermarum]|uniref:Large ribosomal subunit protein uL23 n=1 Tax=Pseudothermotoga thermarum DSM 5069 TaxID=688269 RepID=F7YY17_9THEM|nr:50S ribosomal protein L23 [Pseudothermotoga thermarum]AEH50827.1 LSU ribosomal protein L23P [Pseudothermotoga thermarum DSM 5069]
MKTEKLTVYDVIIRPIITEKSMNLRAQNKYVFEVHPSANKSMIKQAVETIFNVKVKSVNVSNVKPKPKRRGLFEGKTRSWKKAVVTLEEGYTIKELEGQQ